MSGLDPEFPIVNQHQVRTHSSVPGPSHSVSTVEPHVTYPASICAVIGHSHILTDMLYCSRCGEKSKYHFFHTVVLHRSGFWCHSCEDNLPKITFWDRMLLPETVITLFHAMKPNASRPNLTGA